MNPKLAIVGATGAVGSLVCQLIEERGLPFDSIKLIASKRSVGKKIDLCGTTLEVVELRPDVFNDIDIVIGSTPDEIAREFVPWAMGSGAIVVDESGAHRMQNGVPLVVPEVNAQEIANHRGLIASPNCSTTQMVVALKPLHDFATIRRVIVTTYQATSGAGQPGTSELLANTRASLEGTTWKPNTFSHPIAFNVIPQIGLEKHEQYTSEEMKMVWETQKIFDDDTLLICPTCVRVPVSNGHSESIVVETEQPISPCKATELFAAAPGVSVMDDLSAGHFPTPLNCCGTDDVFVGRIRTDISHSDGLAFWCVSDNLRKGAATNAVQIVELLIQANDR